MKDAKAMMEEVKRMKKESKLKKKFLKLEEKRKILGQFLAISQFSFHSSSLFGLVIPW